MAATSRLTWRWKLSNGGTVEARIDDDGKTEVVAQGDRVLAESARSTKPEGHSVLVQADRPADRSERPPLEVVVTFDPRSPICVLRADGHEVTPVAWPTRERPPPPRPERSYATPILMAVLAAAALGGSLWLRALIAQRPGVAGKLGSIHRAPSGLFVAHFDEGLATTPAILPSDADGIVLQDKSKTTTIVVAALKPPVMRDAWALHQRLHDEALANLPKGAGRFEETGRSDGPCLGETGAIVTGTIMRDGEKVARVRSCAFTHDGAGYLTMSMLAEPASTEGEQRVKAVIDATELTRLAERAD